MTRRLTQVEEVNKALRLEVKEKNLQINTLKAENEKLRLASSDEEIDAMARIIVERDHFKK